MKKTLISILMAAFFLVSFTNQSHAQKPDYEKYGRIAMAVVQADFPGSPIRDYEYLGRKKMDSSKVEDGFRFKVQENNQNFFVIIRVNHDLTNNKLLNLTVETQKQ
ncbi:MAG: DUF3889 domain-containing protein [Bacillus sp. (in: firmicutes)]